MPLPNPAERCSELVMATCRPAESRLHASKCPLAVAERVSKPWIASRCLSIQNFARVQCVGTGISTNRAYYELAAATQLFTCHRLIGRHSSAKHTFANCPAANIRAQVATLTYDCFVVPVCCSKARPGT